MGNSLDKSYSTEDEDQHTKTRKKGEKRKRGGGRSRKDDNDADEAGPSVKVARLDTVKYVHERLFINGENSDLKITACGRTWNLHRLYLEQCDYFKALLNGGWSESKKDELHLDYSEDSNLTAEALDVVFASLYSNELEIGVKHLDGVVAAAAIMQIPTILEKCDEIASENLQLVNALHYHNLANAYGLKMTRDNSFNFVKHNFYKYMALENRELLLELHEDVLLKLLSSSDLLFTEGELDLYKFIKSWLYVQADPSSIALNKEDFIDFQQAHFSNYEPGIVFLDHAPIFAALRLHSLTVDTKRLEELEKDNLIPKEVLRELIIDQWKMMLTNEEEPNTVKKLTPHDFTLNSIRCGRVVEEFNKCWRWLGYNNGVDINLYMNEHALGMRRNCTNSPYSTSLSSERMVHYRVIIASSKGEILCDTGDKSAALKRDESMQLCVLPTKVELPISVHIQYLTSLPPQPAFMYVGNYVKMHGTQTV